ncbi:potassium voltage-gated channel protein Shaw-like [Saccostrea echinata]|uniref:potassium voltage-gated channel protein Shaw-like n=1 Tax=Saccostrea echinata TaxID=191078 RepID=UPI002A8308A0|nr:potassium voltage-gated channel protein Shaw-like [Saccostrea echinata]
MGERRWIYAIFINVGGTIFQTRMSTLKKIPDSRLGSLSPASPEYNAETDEYFFDHSPVLFSEILDLYRTGELHIPSNCCGAVVQKELEYWKIPKSLISECCIHSYHRFVHDQYTIQSIRESFEENILDYDPREYRKNNYRKLVRTIWITLDQPKSSICAKIFNTFYLVLVMLSVLVFLLSYQPYCRTQIMTYNRLVFLKNYSDISLFKAVNLDNTKQVMFLTTEVHPVLDNIDLFCIAFFTLELLAHFLTCPRKLKFFTYVLNVLDVYLVVAMWTTFAIETKLEDYLDDERMINFYSVLKATLVLRLLRFFRLMKQFSALKILFMSLKASIKELFLLFITFLLASVLFASFMYFAEFDKQDVFPTIFESMWWAIITMTTVGYGDMYPTSFAGKLVGIACAAAGIVIIAMPIAVVAANFSEYYLKNSERRLRGQLMKNKKKKQSCCSWGESPQVDSYTSGPPSPTNRVKRQNSKLTGITAQSSKTNDSSKKQKGKKGKKFSNGKQKSETPSPAISRKTDVSEKHNGIWYDVPDLPV